MDLKSPIEVLREYMAAVDAYLVQKQEEAKELLVIVDRAESTRNEASRAIGHLGG